MSLKPAIGIATVYDDLAVPRIYTNNNYPAAVIRGGGAPLLLPVTADREVLREYVSLCQGFVFSGGQDVSPMHYGELQSPHCGPTSLLLDDYQLTLIRMVIESGKPFIAICRGIQVLNVALGGTLYQDISEYSDKAAKHMQQTERGDVTHPVSIVEGTILHSLFGSSVWTNSYHHQALKQVADRLQVAATCSDGIVEAVEVRDYGFGLGLQWHPEAMLPAGDAMLPLFTELAKQASER